jgi:hypothetical protein
MRARTCPACTRLHLVNRRQEKSWDLMITHRRRAHWDRAAQLLLNGADASEISRQLELGLFYDRQLDFRAANAQT